MGKSGKKTDVVKREPMEALRLRWRESDIRKAMREATGLDDAAIEEALAKPEVEAELAAYAQVMVRESLVAVVEGVIARAQKENTAARMLLELAEANRLVGLKKDTGPTAEEEVTAFEQAILGNLRELIRPNPDAEAQRTQRSAETEEE